MRHTKGITLIETLFGIFIVCIAALALAATTPMAATSRYKSDLNSKAMSLAQKQMENMRYLGFPALTDSQLRTVRNPITNELYIDSSSPTDGPYTFTNVDVGAGDSPASVLPNGTAVMVINSLDNDTKEIIITITWTDRQGTRTYRTGTVICNL